MIQQYKFYLLEYPLSAMLMSQDQKIINNCMNRFHYFATHNFKLLTKNYHSRIVIMMNRGRNFYYLHLLSVNIISLANKVYPTKSIVIVNLKVQTKMLMIFWPAQKIKSMLKWQHYQEVIKLAWLLVDQEIQNKYYKIYNNAIIMLFLMRIY